MKPLNRSEQSRRFMRWFKYGSIIGFVLALLDYMLLQGDVEVDQAASDVMASSFIVFAVIIVLSGVAGGLMAIIASWLKR